MSALKFVFPAIFAGLLISSSGFGADNQKLVWGENVGYVFAHVDGIDNEKGLTIRAAHSADSTILGHLPKGTNILCYNEFKDGWVKLKGPSVPAWVNLKFLKPMAFEGMVTAVDQQDLCLAIKAGPSASREKVGCAQIGEVLKFTGVMTTDNWIQLAERQGWVTASSIQASLKPSPSASSSSDKPGTASAEKRQTQPPEKASAPGSLPGKSAGSEVQKGPLVMCSGRWCVNYDKAQVTLDGKNVPSVDCFKDTVCSAIVGQHHVAKAILDGSITFGKFKLSSTGAISTIKGEELVNCGEAGGIDHKCVAKFLSRMIGGGVSEEKEKTSVTQKTQAPKEQMKKAQAQKGESWKTSESAKSHSRKASAGRGSDSQSTEPAFSSSFFDKDEQYRQSIEEGWEDTTRRGF